MPTRDIVWLLLGDLLVAGLVGAALVALFNIARAVQEGMGRLASRTHEPFVTASLEPSAGDHDHVDLVIENCGFAPAFDVKLVAMPEIPTEADSAKRPADWHHVSLLRPGQSMRGYACRAKQLRDMEIFVDVSWQSRPQDGRREEMQYLLDMRRYAYQAPYAAPTDGDELLSELRRFRRDWRPVARGDRPLTVDLSGRALGALEREVRSAERTEPPGETAGSGDDTESRVGVRGVRKNAPVPLSEVRPSR